MSASSIQSEKQAVVIFEIDHTAEEANLANPSVYVNPVTVLFVHTSQEKAQLKFQEIIAKFKQTQGTELCKYVLEFKTATCVEVREIQLGWVKNTKTRVKTICLSVHKYGDSS